MNNNELYNLITSRRTYSKFLDKETNPVSDKAIKQCLEAAITAPNHQMTQPWLFWELGLKEQTLFAEFFAENKAKNKFKVGSNSYQDLYQKSLYKFHNFPKVILVGQKLADDELTQKEDYAACACAIQNFQLMAWQQNIGMKWGTGAIIRDERSYQLLNIKRNEIELIGALIIGNIDDTCKPSTIKRKSLNEVLIKLD